MVVTRICGWRVRIQDSNCLTRVRPSRCACPAGHLSLPHFKPGPAKFLLQKQLPQ